MNPRRTVLTAAILAGASAARFIADYRAAGYPEAFGSYGAFSYDATT